MSNQTGFLLITYPRSGTHMLRGLLNSHPDVTCYGEVFNTGSRASLPRLPTAKKLREVLHRGALRGAVVHMYHGWAGQRPIWGKFKTHTELFKIIPADTTVVVLQRWNLLRRFVSAWLAAKHHKKWQIYTNKRKHWQKRIHGIGKICVTIPADELRADIDAIRMIQSTRGLVFQNACMLTYEQLCKDTHKQMRRVFRHIGADPLRCPAPSTKTRKVGLTPLREQVTNYAELKKNFAGTDLEVYFDE